MAEKEKSMFDYMMEEDGHKPSDLSDMKKKPKVQQKVSRDFIDYTVKVICKECNAVIWIRCEDNPNNIKKWKIFHDCSPLASEGRELKCP